jgi:hypothetical protein
MEQPVVNDSWSDQVNDSGTCKHGSTDEDGVNMNESRTEVGTAYAIKWGEKIEVSALSHTACCTTLTDPSPYRLQMISLLKSAQQTWLITSVNSIMSCQMAVIITARCFVCVR